MLKSLPFMRLKTCNINYDGQHTRIRIYRADHITRTLSKGKYFELQMLEHIKDRLPSESVAIDAGAFVGNHSLFLAKHCKCKIVHAFEPFPLTFKLLNWNIKNNASEGQIISHNLALGASRDDNAKMHSPDKHNQGSNHLSDDGETAVRLTDLDSYLGDKIPRLDFIKIDTEGFGLSVLKGAIGLLQKYRPLLAIEINPEPLSDFLDFLSAYGYKQTGVFNATPTYIFESKG